MGPWAILSIFGLALAGILALLIYVAGLVNTMAICFVVISVMMMLVVLIQKPKGGGLSGAFGSAGGGETAFGAKTGDVLTYVTISCFIAFILLAMGLTWTIHPGDTATTPEVQSDQPAPAAGDVPPVTDLTAVPGESTPTPAGSDAGATAPVEAPAAPATPAAPAAPVAPAPAPATPAPANP
jgi:preprotein translocase subunit SecG